MVLPLPQCRVGSQLKVRVGGDFWSEPPPEELPDLLLVAGGIGVNPLYSILKHHMHLISMAGQSVHICLLYSARTEAELLFKVRLPCSLLLACVTEQCYRLSWRSSPQRGWM